MSTNSQILCLTWYHCISSTGCQHICNSSPFHSKPFSLKKNINFQSGSCNKHNTENHPLYFSLEAICCKLLPSYYYSAIEAPVKAISAKLEVLLPPPLLLLPVLSLVLLLLETPHQCDSPPCSSKASESRHIQPESH